VITPPFYSYEQFLDEIDIALSMLNDGIDSPTNVLQKEDWRQVALDAAELLGCWNCFSCGQDTADMGEDFYVKDELWKPYGVEGVLCVGCFEVRLGRQLSPNDFKGRYADAAKGGTLPEWAKVSDRLRDRLGIE
jgi:hypothetical protein